jgi:hypothetical protein
VEIRKMIKEFQKLPLAEAALLYRAPAMVSVFASCSNEGINKTQKADAIKLAHLKTFTANPLLLSFYQDVEKTFESDFELLAEKYFPFDETKKNALRKDIGKIDAVIPSLDKEYGAVLRKSFVKYERHVRKAGHSIFQDFIFPIPIQGLSD